MFDEIKKERILTNDETVRIMTAIEKLDKRYKHLKEIITVGLNTAMRIGEILGMEKSWIDLKAGIINVPYHSHKRGRKNKHVPINSAIKPILAKLLMQNRDLTYNFVNPKTGTRYFRIQNAWNGILREAKIDGKPGVDKLRLHDLRHTCTTNLARYGKNIKFISQYLGHKDVKTSARYIHYSDEDLKRGAEELVQVPSDFTTFKIESA